MTRRPPRKPAGMPAPATPEAPPAVAASPPPAPAPARAPGRPTKLTPEIATEVCALLRVGNVLRDAAAIVGVSASTLREWARRGRRDPYLEVYGAFARDLRRAMAEAKALRVRAIEAAGREDWKAAAWWVDRIERRAADRLRLRKLRAETEAAEALAQRRKARAKPVDQAAGTAVATLVAELASEGIDVVSILEARRARLAAGAGEGEGEARH